MGKYEQLKVGDTATFTKTVTDADVTLFAGVTGDLNPVHINESYASTTFFKKRIAHGVLSGGFISAVIGTQLPGPGTIYMSQSLNFKAPVFIGDTITARVEVAEKIDDKKRLKLKTDCLNQEGKVVISGEAMVWFPE